MEISHPDSKTKKCVLSSYSINTILGEHLEPWLLALEPLTVKSLKIYIWLTGIKSVKKISLRVCLFPDDLYYSLRKNRRFKKYRVATLYHFELYQSFHFRKPFFKIWFLNKAHLIFKVCQFSKYGFYKLHQIDIDFIASAIFANKKLSIFEEVPWITPIALQQLLR